MGRKSKLKVVLLCHFSNEEIQNILNPRKRIGEYAPWIPMLISIFEDREDIELSIISPHEYISTTHNFELRGVHYYFYNAHMPIIGRHWPTRFKWDLISNYFFNKFRTKQLVKKIKPDIIHLFGAENNYYSSTVLQFVNKYPILVSVQGFISKSNVPISKNIKGRIETERQIILNCPNQAVHTETLASDVKDINCDAKIFHVQYPILKPQFKLRAKKFDIVFFARICKDKGIEDLLKALKIISDKKSNISLCVIGGGNTEPFQALAKKLGVSQNITWAGFLPTQEDVHNLASEAKISVLPTYHDIISGTIIESLFLKLPVVAYNVGSIHEVNKKDEIISLVDKWDIEGLASSIDYLLNNEDIRKERAEKGYHRVHEMFDHSEEKLREGLKRVYLEVIDSFSGK